MINSGKPSIFTLNFDRQFGGQEIAQAEFDIANIKLEEVSSHRISLTAVSPKESSKGAVDIRFDDESAFLDITIKGTLKRDQAPQDFTFSSEMSDAMFGQSQRAKRNTIIKQ